MSVRKLQVTVSIKLETPPVPNFLKGDDGKSYPIAYFDEPTLRKLGANWIEELVENAKRKDFIQKGPIATPK